MSDSLAQLFKPFDDIECTIGKCFDFVRLERETRHEAESTNRRKDEFLGIVAHELRNTLHLIGGWVNLLYSRKLDESNSQQAVEAIQRGVKLQTKLIEDLLDISQIGSGKFRLNLREIEITPIIKGF